MGVRREELIYPRLKKWLTSKNSVVPINSRVTHRSVRDVQSNLLFGFGCINSLFDGIDYSIFCGYLNVDPMVRA